MIVNYTEAGWEVITQRSHGLLAAQIGMHWIEKQRPKRWLETLVAIAEHDDAEVELDGENLLTETGGPLNFAMKTFDLEHCRKLSLLTITKSRYIALLTSMHIDFLYRKEESTNSEVKQFLKEQRAMQSEWSKALGLKRSECETIYSLIEWCDACSLLLCQRQLQPEQRAVEISYGPDKVKHLLYQLSAGELTVEPWPFNEAAFNVYFESRIIPGFNLNPMPNSEAFLKAPVSETVWEIVRAKAPAESKKKKKV